MTISNPFIYPIENYNRSIDILKHYLKDQVAHLVIMTGRTEEECKEFVVKQISPNGEFAFKDPEVEFLERDLNTGDRTQQTDTLSNYLKEIINCEDIVAPTFTTYVPPKVRKSPIVGFQQLKKTQRSAAKKLMFQAKMKEGEDSFNYKFKFSEQTGRKLTSNAVSGAHCNGHNPLINLTAHSTLTSNCRQTSGYGNVNNERFIAGNRHYWSYSITHNNIVSIVNHTDYNRLQEAMTLYGLHYPSVEETMDMITYSTKLYWTDKKSVKKLEHLVSKLSPIQRAAFVYTGDMYHLKKYNNSFVKQFITDLIQYISIPDPTPKETIKSLPEAVVGFAAQICCSFMEGKQLGDIEKEQPENYAILAATAKNIAMKLYEYSLLIQTFWITDNLPASVATLPSSLRRVVLASDTDSTIFTVQEWVIWYCDCLKFDNEANNVHAAMTFLTSQTIIHILATMSANAGVEREKTFLISMKNEYKFDVFGLTQLGKHYFALIKAQEGNIFAKHKVEIKGVHLKSSNVPKEVVEQNKQFMISIMNQILKGEKINVLERVTEVADLERSIQTSIKKGEIKYLRLSNIKPSGSYKQGEESSNYLQYLLWNEVFGPKYGMTPPPPYRAIVVATELESKTDVFNWLESLEDKELATRMNNWLVKNNRTKLPSLMLPLELITTKGIPEEIMKISNTRKIIHKASSMFYLVLETLGLYFNHTDLQQLAMDSY